MKPSPILFTFDNSEVAGRFIDGVFNIPNMNGVTVHIQSDSPEEPSISDFKAGLQLYPLYIKDINGCATPAPSFTEWCLEHIKDHA